MGHRVFWVGLILLVLQACDSGSGETPTAPRDQALSASPPAACVQNVLCIRGDHWDPVLCKCVSDVCVSQEDGPCGGFTQNPCTCAKGLKCVLNPIPDVPGTCEPDRCCPTGWNMYSCREENGRAGFNCHNPRQGCPSSQTCGGGCDLEVTRRCPGVCDPLPCASPQLWDPALCRCVDCVTAGNCRGPLPQLCRVCADGQTACAHWACMSGACQVATCGPSR
jgi:hypothetical protein